MKILLRLLSMLIILYNFENVNNHISCIELDNDNFGNYFVLATQPK
jgi:hypothetical protein